MPTSLTDVEQPAADGNNVNGSGHSLPHIWSLNLKKVKAERICLWRRLTRTPVVFRAKSRLNNSLFTLNYNRMSSCLRHRQLYMLRAVMHVVSVGTEGRQTKDIFVSGN